MSTDAYFNNECDRLLYTSIPYVGRSSLPGQVQNGHTIWFDAHKSLGPDAANAMRDRVKQCLDACQGIPDPAAALQQAREALHAAYMAFYAIRQDDQVRYILSSDLAQTINDAYNGAVCARGALGGTP